MATRPPANDLRFDIVVIGGGMVGAAFAIAAATAGLTVAVCDRDAPKRQTRARFDGRCSAIALGGQRLLAALDVWPLLAADAAPVLDIRVSEGESPLFVHYDHRDIGTEPLGHNVENRLIRRALFDRLGEVSGVSLFAPAVAAEIDSTPAGVAIRLEDGHVLRAALAVAADGRESRMRDRAGIRVRRWRYRQTAIVCTVKHEFAHRGVAQERFGPSGPFAILPMTGNRSSIIWTERPELAEAILDLDAKGFHAELAHRFGDDLGAVELVGRRWSYPLSLVHAERYTGDRLVLIGDAAHAIHPIAGQGLNLGLRDVAALAEVVVDAHRLGLDIGVPAVLARYARWRRFDALALVGATDGLNRLFSNEFAVLKIVRNLGLGAVNRLPPVKRRFMRHAAGIAGDLPRLMRGAAL